MYGNRRRCSIFRKYRRSISTIAKRTVYSYSDLLKILEKKTLVILFRYIALDKEISYQEIAKAKVKGYIQSIRKIDNQQYSALIHENWNDHIIHSSKSYWKNTIWREAIRISQAYSYGYTAYCCICNCAYQNDCGLDWDRFYFKGNARMRMGKNQKARRCLEGFFHALFCRPSRFLCYQI